MKQHPLYDFELHYLQSAGVDVGCESGARLAVSKELGVAEVLGTDGCYVDRTQIPLAAFSPRDVEKPLGRGARFDLARSFEVAVHLSAFRFAGLVDDLVSRAPAMLFSVAGERRVTPEQ